jgi:hypothetical protein
MAAATPFQGLLSTPSSQIAEIQLSTYPQQSVQLVEKPGSRVTAVGSVAMHLRLPSISRGFSSFLWGLFLGAFIWSGMLAVGVSGATSFIVGAVAGLGIFFYVRVYGGDEPKRQSRAAPPPR